jgi:hypothetical protein
MVMAIPLASVADLVMLIRFVERGGPPPNPFFKGDLNADCFVDFGDLAIFDSFFTYGLVIFPQFPVPTCCYPDTVRGTCYEGEDCYTRSAENCSTAGGTYLGDGTFCTCDCTGHCDLNLDGRINPIDVVRIVFYVYRGVDLREQNLACPKENGDWNCDDQVNPEDVIAYINYAYRAWDVPPCDPCEP